jgi:hypothetical protein
MVVNYFALIANYNNIIVTHDQLVVTTLQPNFNFIQSRSKLIVYLT